MRGKYAKNISIYLFTTYYPLSIGYVLYTLSIIFKKYPLSMTINAYPFISADFPGNPQRPKISSANRWSPTGLSRLPCCKHVIVFSYVIQYIYIHILYTYTIHLHIPYACRCNTCMYIIYIYLYIYIIIYTNTVYTARWKASNHQPPMPRLYGRKRNQPLFHPRLLQWWSPKPGRIGFHGMFV